MRLPRNETRQLIPASLCFPDSRASKFKELISRVYGTGVAFMIGVASMSLR